MKAYREHRGGTQRGDSDREMLKPRESDQHALYETRGNRVASSVERQLLEMSGRPRGLGAEELCQDPRLDRQVDGNSLDGAVLHEGLGDGDPGSPKTFQGWQRKPIELAGIREHGRRSDDDRCPTKDVEKDRNAAAGHIETQMAEPIGETERFRK